MFKNILPKSVLFVSVGKYGTAEQTTIRRTPVACWISKAIDTHTQNVQYLLLIHSNSGYANAPPYYVYTYITCL